MSPLSLLFENDEILLVNKPAGVSVQGGAGIVHPLDDELSAQLGYRVHLVHRLDKETSGILLVAKTAAAAAKWSRLLAGGQVCKEYCAVCLGIPCAGGKPRLRGTLRGSVNAHGREQSAELHFSVERSAVVPLPPPAGQGSPAAQTASGTAAVPAGSAAGGNSDSVAGGNGAVSGADSVTLSLVRITLGTGRMHQIRIQLAGAGAPLAADDQHGDFRLNKKIRRLGIKRLQLAAVRLTVPLDGSPRTFSIPLPEHMQRTVDAWLPEASPAAASV